MQQLTALRAILYVSIFGLLFSGYLSYQEFFGDTDNAGCVAVGQPGTILGYPPCIYGFFMYLLIVIVAALGLRGKKN